MAYEASEIPRRRFVCRFIPRREEAGRRETALLTRDAREALGAFVHLDVPDHEPGRILVTDEAGVVLLSASWPPGRELGAEGGATAPGR